MTHTPTPWEWRDDQTGYKGVWSIRPGILIADGMDGTPGGDEIDKANADFIIKAVNAHDKLVEALVVCRTEIEALSAVAGKGVMTLPALAMANAALEGLE